MINENNNTNERISSPKIIERNINLLLYCFFISGRNLK